MKCDFEKFKTCLKNNLCHLCDGERLYTPPKVRKPLRASKKKKKEGVDFEKRVVKAYNKTVSKESRVDHSAVRSPNSGSIWSLPGDIITKEALLEAKERGTVTSRGEKTISIQKKWLQKIEYETYQKTNKSYWFLPFRYKGDDKIYVVTDFNIILQLLSLIYDQEAIISSLQQKLGEGDN